MMKLKFMLSVTLVIFTILACSDPAEKNVDLEDNVGPLYTIDVLPAGLILDLDSTYQFSAIGRDVNMNVISDLLFTWESQYPDVATISSSGLLHGISAGISLVTASSGDVRSQQIGVTIMDPIQMIEITPSSVSLMAGETIQLVAIGKDINQNPIEGLSFEWTSTNPDIATVTNTGLVLGIAEGMTTIEATIRKVTSVPSSIIVTNNPAQDIMGSWNSDCYIMYDEYYSSYVNYYWGESFLHLEEASFEIASFDEYQLTIKADTSYYYQSFNTTLEGNFDIVETSDPDFFNIDLHFNEGSEIAYGILEFTSSSHTEFKLQFTHNNRPSAFTTHYSSRNWFVFVKQ